jgi:hypothetical protein
LFARVSDRTLRLLRIAWLKERSALQILEGLPELFLCIHDDRPVPRNWLLERLSGDEEKTNTFVAGVHSNLIALIEEYQ